MYYIIGVGANEYLKEVKFTTRKYRLTDNIDEACSFVYFTDANNESIDMRLEGFKAFTMLVNEYESNE